MSANAARKPVTAAAAAGPVKFCFGSSEIPDNRPPSSSSDSGATALLSGSNALSVTPYIIAEPGESRYGAKPRRKLTTPNAAAPRPR